MNGVEEYRNTRAGRALKPAWEPYEVAKLFRYAALASFKNDEDRLEWARQVILDSRIYFPSPATFNDPFDCRVVLRNEVSFEDWLGYFRSSLARFLPGVGSEEIEARARQAAHNSCQPEVFARVVASLQADVNGCGVLCLSEDPDDILMWSHYSAGHTGVCFEFEHLNEPFFGRCQKVNYSDKMPQVSALRSPAQEQIEAFILTKPIDWEYEKEWRAIEFEKGSGLYEFDSRLLTGLIFGARISLDHRRRLLEWAERRSPRLSVRQAELVEDEYSIRLVEIADSPQGSGD